MKRILIVVGTVALIGVLFYGMKASRTGLPSGGRDGPATGERWAAPDFEVTALDGSVLQLSALKGKVVLVDFWATWCPPCVAEVPHFNELYTNYKDQGFEIVGLSTDEGGDGVVRSFVKSHGVRYPVAMAREEIARSYGGIHGLPTTFLIDKKGDVVKRYLGYRDKKEFEKEIRKLLSE